MHGLFLKQEHLCFPCTQSTQHLKLLLLQHTGCNPDKILLHSRLSNELLMKIQYCVILFFSNAIKVSDNNTQQNMPFESINNKSE